MLDIEGRRGGGSEEVSKQEGKKGEECKETELAMAGCLVLDSFVL